jgi:hypothetical protein
MQRRWLKSSKITLIGSSPEWQVEGRVGTYGSMIEAYVNSRQRFLTLVELSEMKADGLILREFADDDLGETLRVLSIACQEAFSLVGTLRARPGRIQFLESRIRVIQEFQKHVEADPKYSAVLNLLKEYEDKFQLELQVKAKSVA